MKCLFGAHYFRGAAQNEISKGCMFGWSASCFTARAERMQYLLRLRLTKLANAIFELRARRGELVAYGFLDKTVQTLLMRHRIHSGTLV